MIVHDIKHKSDRWSEKVQKFRSHGPTHRQHFPTVKNVDSRSYSSLTVDHDCRLQTAKLNTRDSSENTKIPPVYN